MSEETLLTYRETAERFKRSDQYVRKLKNSGELPHVRLGKRSIRFRASDVDKFIAKQARRSA